MASERQPLRMIEQQCLAVVEARILKGNRWKNGQGAPKDIFGGWRSWARQAGFIGDEYIHARVAQNTALTFARMLHQVRCWMNCDPEMSITVELGKDGTAHPDSIKDQLARAAELRGFTPPPYNPFPGWDEPEGWPRWSQEWLR